MVALNYRSQKFDVRIVNDILEHAYYVDMEKHKGFLRQFFCDEYVMQFYRGASDVFVF